MYSEYEFVYIYASVRTGWKQACLYPLTITVPSKKWLQFFGQALTLSTTASIIKTMEQLQRFDGAKIISKLPISRSYWAH